MKNNIIESLLEERIGLDVEAIGGRVVEKAILARMNACGLNNQKAYAETLTNSKDEWQHLIEMVVVPETWFFRNRKVFQFLARFLSNEWLSANRGRILKVLSMPCSTGEEPYSVAMALMDAGIHGNRFEIVGSDISHEALIRAKRGFYGKSSFRGKDLTYRDRYFLAKGDGYQISDKIKEKVLFKRGNIMGPHFVTGAPFDVIFCRNLMIYMSPDARNQTLETINRLLAEKGIFFSGHAERQTALDWGFEAVNETGVFACRKRCPAPKEKATKKTEKEAVLKPDTHGRRHPAHEKRSTIKKPAVIKVPAAMDLKNRAIQTGPVTSARETKKTTDLFVEARTLADQGRLTLALESCEVFLNENPVHAEAHFLMGLIYEALNDKERAEAFFNRAVYLDPEHVEALNHMAFIELQRGNTMVAERLRQRARRIKAGVLTSDRKTTRLSGKQNGK